MINGTQAFTAVTEVGAATMSFDADGKLSLEYSIDGSTQSKQLERFTFDAAAPECVGTVESRASAGNYSDLWWNATEPGWGLTLSHQGDIIFVLWYTYGDEGRDQWISGATLVKQADGSFAGALQRPSAGTPLLQIAGPATSFPVPEVGSASLSFSDGETGSFSYTLDGVTQTKAITRFVAVAADQPKPLCRVKDAGGGGGGGGSGDGCFPAELRTGKTLDYRLNFLNGTSSTERTVVIGPDSFAGQAAIKSEQQQTNGDVNEFYERIENGNIMFIGSQSFQNGALVNDLRFNQFPTKPLAPDLNVVYDETYTGTSFTAGLGNTSITYRDSLVLRRRESVTVPAGTFDNACYLERIIDITASGFTIRTEFEVWTHPDIGEIKSIGRGSLPVPFETTKELTAFDLN
jgi:hypothetical protein